ncbi:MAG: hypothetical protein KDA58_15770 [Planctomycetaceae bacterium]|nr:hypothetical protein [Planctomycetaceae bacterium]
MNEKLLTKLGEMDLRIQGVWTGHKIYQNFFTDTERSIVGAFSEAFTNKQGRTVGMWMQAKGVSQFRAIVEISRCLGLVEADYERLMRQIGEQPVPLLPPPRVPLWNNERFTLMLDGEEIKTIQRPTASRNQVLILDVFQEDEWPGRIDDPLPASGSPRQLAEVVRSLNRGLGRIVFRRDGTGQGICWEFLPVAAQLANS